MKSGEGLLQLARHHIGPQRLDLLGAQAGVAGERHVLAAALAGHADAIVTQNLRHFSIHILEPFGITALHPEEFLLQQLALEPRVVLPAFKSMRARLQNPSFTAEAFAGSLQKNGLAQTATFLRQALKLI
mgnify:CR=1 FL=1